MGHGSKRQNDTLRRHTSAHVQGPAKKRFPGCENFVLAVAYHFCLANSRNLGTILLPGPVCPLGPERNADCEGIKFRILREARCGVARPAKIRDRLSSVYFAMSNLPPMYHDLSMV